MLYPSVDAQLRMAGQSGSFLNYVQRARKNGYLKRRLQRAECVVTDEVSMLSGETLATAEQIARMHREHEVPWGGLRIIAIGDFAQLPPVQKNDVPQDWAFQHLVWQQSQFQSVYLETTVRTQEERLLSILNHVRNGSVNDEVRKFLQQRTFPVDPHFEGTRLFPRRSSVEEYNQQRLKQIQHPLRAFPTQYEGKSPYLAQLKRDCPIPEVLTLKKDALVMLRKNDHAHFPYRYVNGSLGTIMDIGEELLTVKLFEGERTRPRDLYDIANLYWRTSEEQDGQTIHAILIEKCEFKSIPVTTYAVIQESPFYGELESEWENMLGHQLRDLPPLEHYMSALPELFAWIEGRSEKVIQPTVAIDSNTDTTWHLPATVAHWGTHSPMEAIRFAAANHLCVELGYDGSTRLIEPSSLRKTLDGNIILHARKHQSGEDRSYRVDRIESAKVTHVAFSPAYRIEIASTGILSVPPTTVRVPQPRVPRPKKPKKHSSTVRRPVDEPI